MIAVAQVDVARLAHLHDGLVPRAALDTALKNLVHSTQPHLQGAMGVMGAGEQSIGARYRW